MLLARRKTLVVIVVTVISSLLLTAAPASASHSRRARLAETRREIRATRARIARAVGQQRQIEVALNSLTSQLNTHTAALNAARAKLNRIDLGIRAEKRRLAKLAATSEKRREFMDKRARALYIMGPVNDLAALTGATSLDQFVGRVGSLEFVLGFDKTVLEDLEKIKDDARKAQAALKAKRLEAKDVKEEVEERVELVAELRAAKLEAYEAKSAEVSAAKSQLAALQREQNRIAALIRSRGSASVGSGPVSRSGFAWPYRGRISSPYGPRWGGFHTGIDLDCDTGEGIGASKAGRVIAAEWGGGYGLMVVLDHGNGVTTLYAHNSRLLVSVGQQVRQLQRISICGNTGNSTGDHLHFEVRVNGNHRNPRNFLP